MFSLYQLVPCQIGLRLCAYMGQEERRAQGGKVLARLRTRIRVPMDGMLGTKWNPRNGNFRAHRAAVCAALALAIGFRLG